MSKINKISGHTIQESTVGRDVGNIKADFSVNKTEIKQISKRKK